MIVLTSARFFDYSANESAKLLMSYICNGSFPGEGNCSNVDVAVRELPHANTKPDDLWRNHSKVVHPRPTGRIALRGAQFKRQSVIFDINARGCAVYTSINADKKAFQLHARRTVYEHRLGLRIAIAFGFKRHDMPVPFMAGWQTTDVNPLVIKKSEGSYVYEINGKRYLDSLAGLFCTALASALLRLSLGFSIFRCRIGNSSLDYFYSTSQPFKSRRGLHSVHHIDDLNFGVRNDNEMIQNYNVPQDFTNKMKITKCFGDEHIEVNRLIKGRPLGILEFMQWVRRWMRRYCDCHNGGLINCICKRRTGEREEQMVFVTTRLDEEIKGSTL
ncbi:hypothetical protein OROMI_026224 [Orobanche minor]